MGGSLQLSSVLGQGTLAYLVLPLAPEVVTLDQPLHKQQVQRLQAGNQCRALVVEDDPASCEILVDLLQQIGCETIAAHDGHEGLLQCAGNHFDIIFTDIRMPGISGLDMLRKLRTEPDYATTPIVAVSASSLEHERAFYMEQGFQDFIGKPYAFEDIFNALRKFAGVSFTGETSETSEGNSSPPVEEPVETDIAPLRPQLETLAHCAASGDMSSSRKIIGGLTPDQLGTQRYQQLSGALRQYDLERIEKLIHIWLGEPH
jgi:two-component system, OmpR family, aerobic respiration control sensor histidine kinase ArcB